MVQNESTYDHPLPDLGDQIREWRLAKRLTQSDLEQKAGLSHNAISRIECGSVSPRLQTLLRISQSLEITIEQLQFQQPAQEIAEQQSHYGVDRRIEELVSSLERIPEPKRGELLNTFLNLIEIMKGEGNG
jgi:transcriptional regulator with XRE-family HTH domain